MRLSFSFDYGFQPDEALAARLDAVITPPLKWEEEPPEGGPRKVRSWTQYTADMTDLFATGVNPSAIKLSEAVETSNFLQVVDDIRKIQRAIERVAQPAAPMNERVQVVVPGLGLLAIEQVLVLVDACTDSLQTHLESGWRILAICPQPDQRRPDYILGQSRTP